MPNHRDHCDCADCGASSTSDSTARFALYQKIDFAKLECLNEREADSAKNVFRAYSERLRTDKSVHSDDDAELLFNIPFSGVVRVKSICIIGENDDSHPAELKLFRNRPSMTFDHAQGEADQVLTLNRDPSGQLEYGLKPAKFSSVSQLSVFVVRNFGAENTTVHYIGLHGDYLEPHRTAGPVVTAYESAPRPADHPGVRTFTSMSNTFGTS